MKRQSLIIVAVIAIVLILLIAFVALGGYNPNSNPDPGTTTISGNSVEMRNLAYSPTNLDIPVGTTVTWYNNDTVMHTVTSDDGTFTSSGNLDPGATYSVTFNQKGEYNYHCIPHPFMTGIIVVQ